MGGLAVFTPDYAKLGVDMAPRLEAGPTERRVNFRGQLIPASEVAAAMEAEAVARVVTDYELAVMAERGELNVPVNIKPKDARLAVCKLARRLCEDAKHNCQACRCMNDSAMQLSTGGSICEVAAEFTGAARQFHLAEVANDSAMFHEASVTGEYKRALEKSNELKAQSEDAARQYERTQEKLAEAKAALDKVAKLFK